MHMWSLAFSNEKVLCSVSFRSSSLQGHVVMDVSCTACKQFGYSHVLAIARCCHKIFLWYAEIIKIGEKVHSLQQMQDILCYTQPIYFLQISLPVWQMARKPVQKVWQAKSVVSDQATGWQNNPRAGQTRLQTDRRSQCEPGSIKQNVKAGQLGLSKCCNKAYSVKQCLNIWELCSQN